MRDLALPTQAHLELYPQRVYQKGRKDGRVARTWDSGPFKSLYAFLRALTIARWA